MSITPADVTDVLTLQHMFDEAGTPYDPSLLADLIRWKEEALTNAITVELTNIPTGPPSATVKTKGDKETDSKPDEAF